MANDSEASDKIGVFVSALCCIHCMAIPALILFAPSLSKFFENELIHLSIFVVVIPLGLYAFISKLKVHNDKRPLYVGIVGMLILAIGILSHELSHHDSFHYVEIVSSLIGGLSLIAAHILNIRLCRCHSCEH